MEAFLLFFFCDTRTHNKTGTVNTSMSTTSAPFINPTAGKITSTSASFMCEIDAKERKQYITCALVDTLDGRTWRQVICFDSSNALTSFVFENLRPSRSYTVMIEQDNEQHNNVVCGTIQTPPADPEILSLFVMKHSSCSSSDETDPYEHVLKELLEKKSNRSTEHVNIHLSSLVHLNQDHFSQSSTIRKRNDIVEEENVFRNAFRRVLNTSTLGHLLRNTSNIFASDILRNCKNSRDGVSVSKQSREYERELWDPKWKSRLSAAASSAADFKQGMCTLLLCPQLTMI